jgi:hypothetical protein
MVALKTVSIECNDSGLKATITHEMEMSFSKIEGMSQEITSAIFSLFGEISWDNTMIS